MRDFLVYTFGRIGLMALCYAVFAGLWYLLSGGAQGLVFWPFIAALLVSSFLSLRLLRGPRERFAQHVQRRAERASGRFEEMRAKEDAE